MNKKLINIKVLVVCLILILLGLYWFNLQSTNNSLIDNKLPISNENKKTSNYASEIASIKQTDDNSSLNNKLASVDSLIEGLRQRLELDPEDVKGWALLAKSYHHLQRWQEAEVAFARAKALGYTADIPPINNTMAPSNNSAASLKRLLSSPKNDHLYQAINQTIDRSKNTDATKITGINLRVSLAQNVIEKVSPNNTVFIFARASEGGAPLAALRKQVRDLPLEIRLDDSMSIMPGKTLSKATTVVVGARVSMSGNPRKMTGDFEIISDVMSTNQNEIVALEIQLPVAE